MHPRGTPIRFTAGNQVDMVNDEPLDLSPTIVVDALGDVCRLPFRLFGRAVVQGAVAVILRGADSPRLLPHGHHREIYVTTGRSCLVANLATAAGWAWQTVRDRSLYLMSSLSRQCRRWKRRHRRPHYICSKSEIPDIKK